VRSRKTSRRRFGNQARSENRSDEIGDYRPRWNAAPTTKLPVVISRDWQRILTLMHWGLVPSWPKDLKISHSTFNAHAETIDTRSAFCDAWRAEGRCLVLADDYYEWRDHDKQPFAVALDNRGPMTLAGLWDCWRMPSGDTLRSFSIVTTNDFSRRCTIECRFWSPPTAGPIGSEKRPYRNRCSKRCSSPIPVTL